MARKTPLTLNEIARTASTDAEIRRKLRSAFPAAPDSALDTATRCVAGYVGELNQNGPQLAAYRRTATNALKALGAY